MENKKTLERKADKGDKDTMDKIQKGKETAEKVIDDISINVKEAEEQIGKNAQETKKTLEEEIESGKVKFNKGKNTAEKILDDISRNVKDVHSEFEKKFSEYSSTSPHRLDIDLIETPDMYCLKVDIPGVNKEDVEIEVTENDVKIIAKFPEDCDCEGSKYIKRERSTGKVTREVRFENNIKIKESSAEYELGLLTIMFPKEEKESINLEIN